MRGLSIFLGLMLVIPLTLLVLMGGLGLLMTMGSSSTPDVTQHFTLATLGELSSNGKIVLAGWATQVGCLLSAAIGFYLLFGRARFSKSDASKGQDD